MKTPGESTPRERSIRYCFERAAPADEITMTIFDEKGNEVRRFSSRAKTPDSLLANVPSYWFGPPVALPKAAAVNRFAWDLRYPPPLSLPFRYYANRLEFTEYTVADPTCQYDT